MVDTMAFTASIIFGDLVIFGAGLWGMYWYCKAHRMQDAIEYMIEDEVAVEVAFDEITRGWDDDK